MKLYIPTTSRNFNCLFSEESISPRAFYKARGFGYSNWHTIPENPYENCTILYDELKSYSRPNEGYDDYPLVIEVDVPDRLRALMNQDKKTKSYAYDGVLYFTPRSTRFIFFDDKHREIAFSKASGSLETKLVNAYAKQIVVDKPKGIYEVPLIEEPILNEAEISFSQRINKVKGFAFGYYVGSLLSASKELAAKIQKYQSILNMAAAIASSVDKRPTPRQDEQLQALCHGNSLPKALAREFSLDEGTSSAILSYLVQHGWTPDEQTRAGSNLYNCIISPSRQEEAISWLTTKLDAALTGVSGELKKNPSQKNIEICVDTTLDFNIYKSEGKQEQYKLISFWVNKIFADNKYQGSLSAYRSQLADDLTTSAKNDVYGDGWQESKTRIYMNSVRRNIAGEEFTEKWSDGILCSVAAVLMKGDTWEGLRKFMLSEGLSDYSLAFALYGMLTGFASLPRDFMEILWRFADKKYPIEVYFSISDMISAARINQVREDDLPAEFLEDDDLPEAKPEKEKTSFLGKVMGLVTGHTETEQMNSDTKLDLSEESIQILEKIGDEVIPKVDDNTDGSAVNLSQINNEKPPISQAAQNIILKIEQLFPTGKSDRDRKIRYYTEQIISALDGPSNSAEETIVKLKGIEPFKNNDGWGKVRTELIKDLQSKVNLEKIQAKKEKELQNPVLFSDPSYASKEESDQTDYGDKSFLYDQSAWSIICAHLQACGCDKWSIELINQHFELFRNEYKPSYYHPFKKETVQGKFTNYPKDNESVLENYRENLKYRKGLKPDEYKKVKIDSLIWMLKDHYRK